MMDVQVYPALNDPFHDRIRECDGENNANEGYFPHLLPLKEGSEGNPL